MLTGLEIPSQSFGIGFPPLILWPFKRISYLTNCFHVDTELLLNFNSEL